MRAASYRPSSAEPLSRSDSLVAALAWGTDVWFLDEPEHVMRLEDLPERATR